MLNAKDKCLAELNVADALTVGQTLRTLAYTQNFPDDVRELYDRVGRQLIDAALKSEGPKFEVPSTPKEE